MYKTAHFIEIGDYNTVLAYESWLREFQENSKIEIVSVMNYKGIIVVTYKEI